MSTLREAAQALVDRWDTPLWKEAPHTGQYIDALRAALAQSEQLVVGGDDLPTLTKWTPQRKPLAGEELERMYEDYVTHGDIVRAVEKAHGIGD
jgi:hypothetical protein